MDTLFSAPVPMGTRHRTSVSSMYSVLSQSRPSTRAAGWKSALPKWRPVTVTIRPPMA